ncbi:MAG: DUF4340 domain-containing protein [Deltaproteobacteria bacterium]|nr:DUF4340 domain-containing protein [Deltaproteobacteria bacterium]
MQIKKEQIILVLIILALILYLILRTQDGSHYKLPELPEVVEADISKIEISKHGTSIVLDKKVDTWQIAPKGYPADQAMVKNMLDIIGKLTMTALVSESKNYHRYDLDDEKKIAVKAWAGSALKREFETGKGAASYKHTFVRLPGDHRVYHAREYFRGNFDRTVDDLRDKSVLSFEKDEIREIYLNRVDKSITLTQKKIPLEESAKEKDDAKKAEPQKEETIWESADGLKGDKTNIDKLLTAFYALRCESWIEDREKESFTDPICTVQLKGEKEYTVNIFAKKKSEDQEHPAVSSENDYPFMLPQWRVRDIVEIVDGLIATKKTTDKAKT